MEFIILYATIILLISKLVSPYTVISRYSWFSQLEWKLNFKYPNHNKLVNKIFNFTLWHCDGCCFFWTNLLLNTICFNIALDYMFIYNLAIAFVFSIVFYVLHESNKLNL